MIKALGSPAKVAATIKADLTGNATGEFTEKGYEDLYNNEQEIVTYGQGRNEESKEGTYTGGTFQENTNWKEGYQGSTFQDNPYRNSGAGGQNGKSGGQIALIIILCIFASPILFSVAATVFAMIIALAAVLFAMFVTVTVLAFSMVIVGIVLFVIGIVKMFAVPFGGLCLLGSGLVCAGIGILFVILSIWVCTVIIPAVIKGVVKLCRMPFKKKRGVAV